MTSNTSCKYSSGTSTWNRSDMLFTKTQPMGQSDPSQSRLDRDVRRRMPLGATAATARGSHEEPLVARGAQSDSQPARDDGIVVRRVFPQLHPPHDHTADLQQVIARYWGYT